MTTRSDELCQLSDSGEYRQHRCEFNDEGYMSMALKTVVGQALCP